MEVLIKIPMRLEKFLEYIPKDELPAILLEMIEEGISIKQESISCSNESNQDLYSRISKLIDNTNLCQASNRVDNEINDFVVSNSKECAIPNNTNNIGVNSVKIVEVDLQSLELDEDLLNLVR